MSSTNQTRDTNAGDYLNDVRLYLAQLKAKSIRTVDATITILRQLLSQVGFASAVPTVTTMTLADYDIVDNTGKLICYLPFDLDTLDASNNNDGTVTGTETYVDGPEISSTHPMRKAFSFNGSTYITLANESNFDLNVSNTFSFSFWMKTTDDMANTDYQLIFSKQDDAWTGNGFVLYRYKTAGGDYVLELDFSDGTNWSGGWTDYNMPELYDNLWHHYVITYDGTNATSAFTLYIDGSSETISDYDMGTTTTILNNIAARIAYNHATYDSLIGGLDDFQIWNVELTQADVTRLSGGRQISKDTAATNPAYLSFSDVT